MDTEFFVWSSFALTFLVCVVAYFRTLKTLKKYEKEFAKEIEELSTNKKIVLEKSKVASKVLHLTIKQFKAFNASKSKRASLLSIFYSFCVKHFFNFNSFNKNILYFNPFRYRFNKNINFDKKIRIGGMVKRYTEN